MTFLLASAATGIAHAAPSIVSIQTDAVDNESAHRTSSFTGAGALLVRRGQAFDVAVEVSEALAAGQRLQVAARNTFLDGDTVETEVLDNWTASTPPDRWAAKVFAPTVTTPGLQRFVVRLRAPVDAAVGLYEFDVTITEPGNPFGVSTAVFPEPVVVLFNPWASADTTSMAGETNRSEHVLRQVTSIWLGSRQENFASHWRLGQFSSSALTVALDMLTGLQKAERRDPALVARRLAARVNSQDSDGGLLTGNWSGPYGRCYSGLPSSTECTTHAACDTTMGAGNGRCAREPWKWSDTAAILAEYFQRGGDIRHAQCPVFAGVLATTLRTLGIPARVVTGFDAVVDSNLNGVRDVYCTRDALGVMRCDAGETMWNFHVWVEAWMRRAGVADWQALDATPQIVSEGLYRIGPAPLPAVRTAPPSPMEASFDVTFVRSQVTAPTTYWARFSPVFPYLPWGILAGTQQVVTRRPGQADSVSRESVLRDDVTSGYRLSGTSAASIAPTARAGDEGSRRGRREAVVSGEVSFDLATTPDVVVGDTATWTLHLENTGASTRTVKLAFQADAVANTGEVLSAGILAEERTEVLAPGATLDVVFEVDEAAYTPLLAQTRVVEVTTTAAVVETDGVFLDVSRAVVGVAGLVVSATPDQSPPVGEARTVGVEFANPLVVPMTNVVLRYETAAGATVGGAQVVEVPVGTVMPGGVVSDSQAFVALDGGSHLLSMSLVADELEGVAAELVFSAVAGAAASPCGDTPLGGCREAAVGASSFQLRAGTTPAKNQLKWKWAKGDETFADEFLDPDTASPVSRLCVYDGAATTQPRVEIDVAPGGTCGDVPCWKRAGSGALSYRNKAGSAAGITGVRLKPGAAGKASVQVTGKGASLALPTLPLAGPVTVQWVATTGATTQCWQATYSAVDGDATKLTAKGPDAALP